MFSSIFVGQSKFISHGQNSAALSLRRARFPRGRTTALNNTLLLSVCVVSGNPWWEVSAVFLWPQEREEELLLLPAERAGMWELSEFFSLCFYGPLTGSFLRWGLIHVVWNRKHTHTLFCLHCIPPLLSQGFNYSSNYNKQARTTSRGHFPCLHQYLHDRLVKQPKLNI